MLKYKEEDPFPAYRQGNTPFQRIVCDQCGMTDSKSAQNGISSPSTLERHWRVKGWDIDLRKGVFKCRQCVNREIEARRNKKGVTKVEKQSPPSQSSALAKKIMSDLLFDHYDLSAQDYKDGWSDKRIADESGLSEIFVAQRRSADYGPVKPKKPPVDVRAKAALAHAQVKLKEIIARAQALESISKDALEAMDAMIAAIEADKQCAAK